jgi:hypothetical protein
MTTFAKLNNGSWGLRGSNLVEGQTVTVVKRGGQKLTLTVGRVIWRGKDGTCLAEKASSGTTYSRTSSRGRSGRCRGCGGPIVDASHHRAMGGYCGSCAFDEFDC